MIDLDHKTSAARTAAAGIPGTPGQSRRQVVVAVALAVLGVALIAAPVVLGMFSRAPQGATMLSDFKPFMSAQRLDGFSGDIRTIDASVTELDPSPAARSSAPYQQFSKQWPAINTDMSGLMSDVRNNLGNYQAVAGLPSFALFPWFFVVPGVLVLGIALLSLRRRRWTRGMQVPLAILGIGLVAAPLAFGMFTRAPRGGEMMTAFKSLETTQNVGRIQGYFSTMAVGQGTIRLDVVPALRKSGLSQAQLAAQYPATTRLDAEWVHILNDMTPMIGAMSDNVGHYQALVALPPFPLFPWFFLGPGVVVVALVLTAGAPRRRTVPGGVS